MRNILRISFGNAGLVADMLYEVVKVKTRIKVKNFRLQNKKPPIRWLSILKSAGSI